MQFEERYDVAEESVLIRLFLVREDVLAAVDFPPYLKSFHLEDSTKSLAYIVMALLSTA